MQQSEVRKCLAEVRAYVEAARAMPMSTSAVINRAELLALIDATTAAIPAGLDLLPDDAEKLRNAQRMADQIVADGRNQARIMVSERSVYLAAKEQAEQLLNDAQEEAAEIRHGIDDYVDSRLANFEVALQKIAETVRIGRSRLVGSSRYEQVIEHSDHSDPMGSQLGRPS